MKINRERLIPNVMFAILQAGALLYSMQQISANSGDILPVCFWGFISIFIVSKFVITVTEAVCSFTKEKSDD